MVTLGNHASGTKIDENLIRHFVLNSIRSYNVKFRKKYGEMVIACDDTNNWRKQHFPYYKANRKKSRDASALDWSEVFTCLNKIREELKEYFPYKVIQIGSAEADDVIGCLCKRFNREQPILIVSGDKDFRQLQIYNGVEQYDPVKKKYMIEDNPSMYLKEHIIRGDKGDGIPNFLSADDSIITGTRQTSITQKKLDQWILEEPENFCDMNTLRNWKRNQILIDLSKVPDEIYDKVINSYYEQSDKNRNKLFNYFVSHKLKNLLSDISDF